jgi:3-hydroxyacyl-CoA dehydrogenase/enoyl-CoA hydratase/3-hydroxybutyryl-CoA epimerase
MQTMEQRDHMIGVVGAGTLGTTVGQLVLDTGDRLVLVVRSGSGKIERARGAIDRSLEREVGAGRLTRTDAGAARGRVEITADPAALAGCGIVIESVPEQVDAKRHALALIEEVTADDTVITSTTSAIPAHVIAAGARRPERVIVTHYVWPANRVRLVEMAVADGTAADALRRIEGLLERQNKVVVRTHDTAGFLITRVLFAYWAQMVELLTAGWGPDELDARALDAGWPTGPCRLMDNTSLLTPLDVLHIVAPVMRGRADALRNIERIVAAGFTGRATGAGLYRYEGAQAVPNLEGLALLPRTARDDDDPLLRLTDSLVNEAAWCVAEGAVGSWEDAARGVDLAYGVPGGLLGLATDPELRDRLHRRATSAGLAFEPSPALDHVHR